MRLRFLTTPAQRAMGAMFKGQLGDRVLVFVYPHPAPRLFHTFFCPPLRLIALDGEGERLFDQVFPNGRFVRLPACHLVVEADPGLELSEANLDRLARQAATFEPPTGAWRVETSLDNLLYALIKEALADLRRVHEAHDREETLSPAVLRDKFAAWERGQFTGSAGLLLDCSPVVEVPETAVRLSHQLLQVEAPWQEALEAAQLAGAPWSGEFPQGCFRCDGRGSWRRVLEEPPGLADELAWRYERPENHFLLCRRCAHWLGWQKDEPLRLALTSGLWGRRFAAWQAWHQAAAADRLPPAWDQRADPLWPPAFGGETWERGSGARAHAEPRLPIGVSRTAAQRAALRQALNGRGGIQRQRGRGQFAPWQPFLQLTGLSLKDLA